jgi:hypothetical protein
VPVGLQELHGGRLLKISSAAEDDFIRLNLLWTGFFGETCENSTAATWLLLLLLGSRLLHCCQGWSVKTPDCGCGCMQPASNS